MAEASSASSLPLDAVVVAGLVALGVVAPALLALWTHSLGIPRNDDWAYRRVLLGFVRTGHYSLVGWGSMTLVGQILWSAPFVLVLGARPWVPSLAVACLGGAGVVAAYLLARRQLGRAKAAAAVLVLVALPGFALSTADFMTDVPTLSAEIICLFLGGLAIRSSGGRQVLWLASSMAAGVFGFCIREFALAAPLAVLVALAWSDRRRAKACGLFGALGAAACGAVYLWSAGLHGAQPTVLGLPGAASFEALAGAYFTLSFMVSPVLPGALLHRGLLARRPGSRSAPRWPATSAAALVLVVGVLVVVRHHPLFIGNYLDRQGAGGDAVLGGTRPELFPGPVWTAIKVIALGSGAALAALLVDAGRRLVNNWAGGQWTKAQLEGDCRAAERRMVVVFTWASTALLVGYGLLARAPFWDRYLWPVAFGVALSTLGGPAGTVLAPGRRGSRAQLALHGQAAPHSERLVVGHWLAGQKRPARTWGSWASTALACLLALALGATTMALTLNSDSYDAARWAAGQELVRSGYPAGAVDAGIEWVGSHSAAQARPGRKLAGAPAYEQWYDQMFPGFRDCALVSASRLMSPSLHLEAALTYYEIAFGAPEHLYLYGVRGNKGCGAPRPAREASVLPG